VKAEMVMACKSCGSDKQRDFSAEMIIHFPGRKGLDKPVVPVLTKLVVCLDCGSTMFTIADAQLRLLEEDAAGQGDGRSPKQTME
jgi:hypothetical protein